MRMNHLPYILSTLLMASFIHADEVLVEMTHQPTSYQLGRYARASLGADVFGSHIHGSSSWEGSTYRFKNTSIFTGARWDWEYLKPRSVYAGADVTYAIGRNHTRGDVNGYCTRNIKRHHDQWLNAAIGVGYNFQPVFAPHFLVSAFAGPGYHFERQAHHNAQWEYAMVGLKTTHDFSLGFNLGLDFKMMYAFDVRDHFLITAEARGGLRKFLGTEIGLPLTWHSCSDKKWEVRLKPYMLKFSLGSPITYFGARLELGVRF